MHHDAPSIERRFFALAFGPVYLAVLAAGFASWTGAPLKVTFAAVLAGAGVITAVLVAFGVKAYRHRGPARRFNLGTVLLLIIPLCVYLTAIRQVVRAMPPHELQGGGWWVLILASLFLVLFTTTVLLHFAEAVMWLLVGLRRWRASATTAQSPELEKPPTGRADDL